MKTQQIKNSDVYEEGKLAERKRIIKILKDNNGCTDKWILKEIEK